MTGAHYQQQVRVGILQPECQVPHAVGVQVHLLGDHTRAIHFHGFGQDRFLQTTDPLVPGFLHLLGQICVLVQKLIHGRSNVRRMLQQAVQCVEGAQTLLHVLLHGLAGDGFDTPDPRCQRSFGDNTESADLACARYVYAPAQLHTVTEFDHTHSIPVLLAEQRHRAHGHGLLHRGIPQFLQGQVGTDQVLHLSLHLCQFLRSDLGEVRDVKTQTVGGHHGPLLLHMRAQHFS